MRALIDTVCRWVCDCGHRNPLWRAQCRACGSDRQFGASAS
ncbi:hypothetical protein AB0M87_04830 [Streptomyces sp. NPDC051320]